MGLLCFGTVTGAGLSLLSVVAFISNWLANEAIRPHWPDYRKIPCLHDVKLILPAVVGFLTLVGSCWTRWRRKSPLSARCSECLSTVAAVFFVVMNLVQNPRFRHVYRYPKSWNDEPGSLYKVVDDSQSFASSGVAVRKWQTSTAVEHATRVTTYGFFVCVVLYSLARLVEPDPRIPSSFAANGSRQPVASRRRSPLIISITILVCAIVINYLNSFVQLFQPEHLNPWILNIANNAFVNAQFGLVLNLFIVPISIMAITAAYSSSWHHNKITMLLPLSLASLSASIVACIYLIQVFQDSRDSAVVIRKENICDGQIDIISMDLRVLSPCEACNFLALTSYFPPLVFPDEVWCQDVKATSSWIRGFCLGLNGVMVVASLALLCLSWSLNDAKDLVVGVLVKVYNVLLKALINLPSFLVQFAKKRRWSNIDQDIKTDAKSAKPFVLFVGTSMVLLSTSLFTSECLAVLLDDRKVASRATDMASYLALALSASSLVMGLLTLVTIRKPSAKLFAFHLLPSSVVFAGFLVWNQYCFVEERYGMMLGAALMRNYHHGEDLSPQDHRENGASMDFRWTRVVRLVFSGLSAVLIPVLMGCMVLFEGASLVKLWMPKPKVEKEDWEGRRRCLLLVFMLFATTFLACCLAMVLLINDDRCVRMPTELYIGWEVYLSSAATLSILVLFFSWKKNMTGKFLLLVLSVWSLVASSWVWNHRSWRSTRLDVMTMPAWLTCNGNVLLVVMWAIAIAVSLTLLMMSVREMSKSMWDAYDSCNAGSEVALDPSGDVAETPLVNPKMKGTGDGDFLLGGGPKRK